MRKGLCILLSAVMAVLAGGCASQPQQQDANHIRIALVCRADMERDVEAYRRGVEMAIEEYSGPWEVSAEVYGLDAMEFESSMQAVNALAENPDITAVITMQDYEVIDAAARTMEENSKAFFAVQGYYSKTAQAGYATFFPFSLNEEHLGYAMGLYAVKSGAETVGCIHSGTEFEMAQANAFDRAAYLEGVKTAGSLSEPFSTQSFAQEIALWEAMGVDTAYVPYYRSYWAVDILRNIRERMPEIQLLSCFTPGTEAAELFGDIEGTVVPAFYPVEQSQAYRDWARRYEEKYGENPENEAVQGYDIANLVISHYKGDNRTVSENIRKNGGDTAGVGGEIVKDLLKGLPEITYDEADAYAYEYLVVKDGQLVRLGE